MKTDVEKPPSLFPRVRVHQFRVIVCVDIKEAFGGKPGLTFDLLACGKMGY